MKTNIFNKVIRFNNKQIIFMSGVSGSGKSTRAKELAKELNAEILSYDDELMTLTNGDYSIGRTLEINGVKAFHLTGGIVKRKYYKLMNSDTNIIIDSTNLYNRDYKDLLIIALNAGVDEKNIRVERIPLNGLTANDLVKRNKHYNGIDVINKMLNAYNANSDFNIQEYIIKLKNGNNIVIDSNICLLPTLEEYEKNDLIKRNTFNDLIIWNYTINTTFNNEWDNITKLCRSLVTDSKGFIVSRGLPKFFNYEEICFSEPKEFFTDIKVYEKLDGSYIGAFYYNGKWMSRSKSSFTTEQAILANKLLQTMDMSNFNKEHTHNFEIIYPTNRIVVDYHGETKLVYLNTTTNYGTLYVMDDIPNTIEKAKVFDMEFDFDKLKQMDDDKNEGFVCRNGKNQLFKVKFNTYLNKHAITTNISSYIIWENMRDGTFEMLKEIAPDETYGFIDRIQKEILKEYNDLLSIINKDFKDVTKHKFETMKEVALYIKDNKNKSHIFSLYTGRELDLWKYVKPKYEKPFSNNNNDEDTD